MKHLTTYKIFENLSDIESQLQDVRDILLDLDDIGYTTYVSLTPLTLVNIKNPDYKGIEMFIDIDSYPKRNNPISEREYQLFIDCLLRIKEYLYNWNSGSYLIKSTFPSDKKYFNDGNIVDIVKVSYEDVKNLFINAQIKFRKNEIPVKIS